MLLDARAIGSAGSSAPVGATYIVQTPDATLTNEQALSALATGILFSTTGTGIVSIAVAGTDYQAPGLCVLRAGDTMTGDLILATTVSLVSPDLVRFKTDLQGELRITSSLSDVTTKRARLTQAHYTNAEEPLLIFVANSQATVNEINFGGGSPSFNAATQVDFYAAATNTTLAGTNLMRLTTTGLKLANAGLGAGVAAATLLDALTQDAITNAVTNIVTMAHECTVAADIGFGSGLYARGSSATNLSTMRDMGRLTWEWVVASTTTRASRGKLTSFRVAVENESIRWESNATGAMLGLLGAAAINRPATYTLASTVTRTMPTPEATFTGQDNAQAGSVYAKSADLITLQTRLNDVEGVLRQLITDLASTSGYGLLVAS